MPYLGVAVLPWNWDWSAEVMDIDEEFSLSHLLLHERTCRVCGVEKNLVDNFYRTRKDRGPVSSSYSYECKDCTKKEL